MTIEFKEEEIVKVEERNREPYIGYFAPNGKLINYNTLLGKNYHDAWRNPVSLAFLSWVSYIVKGTSMEDLKEWAASFPDMVTNNQYPGIDEFVKRGYETEYNLNFTDFDTFLASLERRISRIEGTWREYGRIGDYGSFEYQLLLFFRNAYKNKRFFDAIQRKIAVEDSRIVKKRLRNRCDNSISDDDIDKFY